MPLPILASGGVAAPHPLTSHPFHERNTVMPAIPEWLRSVLITFATTFALTVLATGFEVHPARASSPLR